MPDSVTVMVFGASPHWQYQVVWDPVLIGATMPYHAEWVLNLERTLTITKVGSVLAVSQGDLVEASAVAFNQPVLGWLYAHTLHKETVGIYDAWHLADPLFPCRTQSVKLMVDCKSTKTGFVLNSLRPPSARFTSAMLICGSE